jgi:hypothetical protein
VWRWLSPKGHRHVAVPPTGAELEAVMAAEACAVVEGRVVDQLWAQGRPIPGWAWLNALAHRPVGEIGDLVGLACDQPEVAWADAVVDIALALNRITEVEAAQIQAELFLPAELREHVEGFPLEGPDQLVRMVRRRLARGSGRPRPKTLRISRPTEDVGEATESLRRDSPGPRSGRKGPKGDAIAQRKRRDPGAGDGRRDCRGQDPRPQWRRVWTWSAWRWTVWW